MPRPDPRLLSALAALTLLAACQKRGEFEVAARVNRDIITAEHVAAVLQQRGVRAEPTDAAGRQVLERLIDQQLAYQKADSSGLERDPKVQAQFELARREILARAHFEKVGEAAAKPTPEDVRQYYLSKPALFRERRIYNIQELVIEAKPDQVPLLRSKLAESRNAVEFAEFLKANDFRFAANQAVRAAEQLPPASLEAMARLQDGQAMVNPAPTGIQVVFLAGSRSQPVSEDQARPAIEAQLLAERKRKLVEEDLKTLRAAAKVEYEGRFASAPVAASAPR